MHLSVGHGYNDAPIIVGDIVLGPSAGLRYEGPTVVDEDLGIGSVYIWDIRRYRVR
jgi:hypothetical protein